MEIRWRQFFSGRRYRCATRAERRLIELQIAAGMAIRARRNAQRISQKDLARRLQTSQSQISKIEQAAPSASLDLCIRALLELGATDDELFAALSPTNCRPVQMLRARAALPYYPKPLDNGR